jgi:hypothetical protein
MCTKLSCTLEALSLGAFGFRYLLMPRSYLMTTGKLGAGGGGRGLGHGAELVDGSLGIFIV